MDEGRRTRYLRAKPIALAALDLVEAERELYVAANCGDDDTLRNEVRWMLEAAEATVGTTLPRLAVVPEVVGTTINAAGSSGYRILRQLGEGGGGVVYLAERSLGEGTPDELRQQVAIKFLHTKASPGCEPLRRFAEERRILATLNHPNIAHLIDGGTTRDGRSFIALEYVQGERIDRWCEHKQLPLRERVELFLKVCAAVHYAHQRLVIHRDLKPGNILVTDEGEPKLLDFGIARLLDHVGGVAATQTRTDMRALTLAYASPEQLRGRPLGTGADVWSLGVVLYQLVCGVRPFGDDDEVSPVSLSQAIDTGKLLPPSRRLRQAAGAAPQRREVSADIDAIVMKALRRDPCERYAGVDALADDLRRFLAARPVRARHGAVWYRARLYLRRHALAMGAAALVLALLATFAVQRMQQLRRLELERDKTTAIAGFLQNLFENADPTHAHGSNLTVRAVLDRGAATLMARKDIAAPVRVSLLLSMGRAYNQLGLGGQAIPLLEEARQLQSSYDASVLERGRVLAALGRAYSTVINLAAAVPLDREAIALLAQAPGDHADEILRVRINLLYNELGGSEPGAAAIARETRQILARLAENPASDRELHLQARAVLAMAQGAMDESADATASARDALDEAQRLYAKDDPALVYYRFVLALVSMRHDPVGALQLYRRSIADYDRQVGSVGPGMSGMLTYFGVALAQGGDLPDARDALERSARLTEAFARVSPDFQLYTLTELAKVYVQLGRTVDADVLLQPQLAQLDQRARTGLAWARDNRSNALVVLGEAALARGSAAEATQRFGAALTQMGTQGPHEMPDAWGRALAGLGDAALLERNTEQAAQWLAQLVDFNRTRRVAPTDPGVVEATLLDARLRQAQRGTAAVAELAGPARGAPQPGGGCRGEAPAVDSPSTPCHDAPEGAVGRAAGESGAKH